jgi:N-acetylglucosaminyldiphosphoundecaprenol N-acetyl-beta-D-mannosaminyltransferase
MNTFTKIVIGGIPTARATRAELAAQMISDHQAVLEHRLPLPRVVVSSNGSVIARYHQQGKFRDLIRQADIVDADGMPLVIASKLFCELPLVERVATTDFIHDASALAARNGLKFYFLGAKPGVAQKAADKLRKLHPGLKIVGIRDGYFDKGRTDDICEEIRSLETDVLWVGLGSPLQEQFAIANRSRLAGLTWIKTCGGMFDHCAESVSRAPLWMQKYGLEWLHRTAKEPRRLGGRYLKTNPIATYHLLTKTSDKA